MPRLLTPEEIAERYSQGYRAEPTEQAGYGSLFGAAVDQFQAGLYGVGEAFGLPLGNARRENQYLGALETQRFYEDTGTPQDFRDIQGVGDAARYVGALGVQSAPYMLGIAGGAVAGGPVGAFAAGATLGTADVLQNQREQAGYTRLDTALPLGAAYGAVDALTGIGGTLTRGIARRELERNTVRALDKLDGVGGVAARTGATFLRRGAEEAVGETLQEGFNQLGRISVDPSVGLFDQDALDRYAESAVAGFALGGVMGAGLGGWRRSEGFQPAPIEDDTPTDLLARRQAAPQYNLTTEMQPLQRRIDQSLGIGVNRTPKNYEKLFEAAASEGSGQYMIDPATGLERELSVQELYALRAGIPLESGVAAAPAPVEATAQSANKPKVFSAEEELLISHGVSNISPKKVELVAEIANRGLDPDSEALEPFWTALAENKLGNARKALASAIAEANAASSAAVPQPAAPAQPSVLLPGQPASLPAAAPAATTDVDPTVSDATGASASNTKGGKKKAEVTPVGAAPTVDVPVTAPRAATPTAAPSAAAPTAAPTAAASATAAAAGNTDTSAGRAASAEPITPGVKPVIWEFSDREKAPVGAWVKADFKLSDRQPVYQVRELDVDELYLPELDSDGRLQPEKRKYLAPYTERAKAGEVPPPISVIEMEDGRLRVVDGHRRVMAARAAGKKSIRALVSPLIDTPAGKQEATAELLAELFTGGSTTNQTQNAATNATAVTATPKVAPTAAPTTTTASPDTATVWDEDAKKLWDEEFVYAKDDPTFDQLPDALKALWVSSYKNKRANQDLADAITERHKLDGEIASKEAELRQIVRDALGEDTVDTFEQVQEGKSRREIARGKGVSVSTVTMAAGDAEESIRRLNNRLNRSGSRKRAQELLARLTYLKERANELDESLGIADSSYGRDIDVADFVAGLVREIDSPNQTKTNVGVVGKNAKNKGEKADDPETAATEQSERWIELEEEKNRLKDRLLTADDETKNKIESEIAALAKQQTALLKRAKATGKRLVASLVTKEDSAKGGEDAEVKPLTGDYEDLDVVYGAGVNEDVDGDVDARADQTAEGGEYLEGDEAFEAGTDKPAENPYKAKQLYDELRKFIRSDALGRNVIIVDSVAEILKLPDPEAVLVAEMFIKKPDAYGLAFGGRKAYMIASRINKGEGRAKFLHEVGVHLGLENILTEGQINTLSSQVEQWAKAGDGSLESSLAKKAVARVNAAGTEAKARKNELIAYFVEEAVLAGVDPVAASPNQSSRLLAWLRTVWGAFKRAVRRIGVKPESLTAQDFVNLAYGAARLEVTGAWHGTTASFRKFSNEFVGSRIGTVFGWGTYFTQSKKEATGYSNQKNEAGLDTKLYAVDLAVNENNTFDYDLPVAKQNSFVRRSMTEALKQAGIAESEIDNLTGEDIIGKGRVGLLGKAIEAGAEPKNPSPEFKQAVEEGDYRKATSLFLKAHGIVASKHRSENSRMNVEVNGRLLTPADIDEDIRTVLTSLHTGEYTEQQARTYLAKLEVIDLVSRKGIKGAEEVLRIDVKYAPTEQDKAASLQKLQWLLRSKMSVDETSGFYNIVVFDDSRIIRAADTTNNDKNTIRFGINGSTQATRSTVEKTLAKLPASVRPSVRNVWMALKEYSSRGLDKVVFTADLLDRAVKAGIDSALEYKNLMVERGVKTREHELAVEKIANMYNEIPTAEEARLANALARESTRLGKWAYQPSWMKPVKVDPDLNAQWEQLGEEAQAWIDAMFKFEHETLLRKKKTVLENTTTVYDSIIKAAEDALNNSDLSREEIEAAKRDIEQAKRSKVSELTKFARLFDTWAGMPYLPLKRFGRFAVVAKSAEYVEAEANDDRKLLKELQKSEDHYYVDFVDDLFEANTLKEKLQAEFNGSVESFEREQFDNLYGSEGLLATMSRLRNIIDSQPTEDKIDRTALRRMQSIVSEMYLQALAESSARKSEMRRKGVAGDIDMLKSFATQGKANARFLAAGEYNERIQDALNKMRREARRAGTNRLRASALLNEIMKRYNQTLDYEPSNPTKKITRLTSVWFLATSPAYYIQNLTQPFMMSVPMMAGRHGWTQAANAQLKAYADLKDLIKTGSALSEFNFSKVPADVKEAVDFLVRRGLIDIGLDTELGEFQIDADNRLKAGWNKVDKFLRISAQKMEAVNRLSTAIAAYRLELAKTGDKKAAVEYAAQVINDTHGDYTAFNAPRAFNTNLGKIALQFRKFQLIQLTYLAKLLKNAGFSTPEKRAATAALLFTLGHTGVMAGLRGLPGYAAIAWAAGALFGGDDEPFDLTQWLRQQIGNDDVANLIMRGAPTIVGADMSGKIGMGNALSILPFTDVDLLDRRSSAEALGTLIGGASFGLFQRAADGIALISNGDYYKGLEMLLPKGISDAMKAYRYADEGVTRRNGDVTISPEDLSGLEVVFQAFGIPINKVNVRNEKQRYVTETADRLSNAAATIKKRYAKAYRERDFDTMEEARQDWRKLQDTRRKMGLKPQPLSELLKAPREQAERERNTLNGVQFNNGNKGLVESLV